MLEAYRKHEAMRLEQGVPALPLRPESTASLCELLENPPAGEADFIMNLLTERVSPGVDPAAEVKAGFLAKILDGEKKSPLIDKKKAIEILGTMLGGYNIKPLIKALSDSALADDAAKALSHTTLVYDAFDEIMTLSKTNAAAKKVVDAWAEGEWFASKPTLAETITVKVYKVDGEINTDDFSPAADAWSRPDIPLHALSMGKVLFPDANATIAEWRKDGHQVAFVGDVVGTGSSRKSACNSVLWHIGEDIPHVPNKRRGGVIIGAVIAPIFFNTAEDSGALPLQCDVTKLSSGDIITINTVKGEITNEAGEVVSTFEISPNTLSDEFRAGGRIPLIIGRSLTAKTREALSMSETELFTKPNNPTPKENQSYTLAQKMVGKASGMPGVLPGMAVEPKMTTVGSQDTTGPMTADELKELACLKFQAPLYMQSFCHTAAYPKPADVLTHQTLPDFTAVRGGVALEPGDGVIHSWLNRLLLPDTVGTGGDSHTRFPIGISFPAGSGLVAFAGALGFMPLDMPESVLVRFKGKLNPGITLRDVVNAIPYWAIQKGLMTVPKKNKKNIFNGRILEMEGLPNLTVEQAFELTDAAAERSAAAGVIKLSEKTIATYLRSNVALMNDMIAKGYNDADTLRRRIKDVEAWLANPELMSADDNAEYAEIIEIDLAEIKEPILACPNDPDDVKLLSDVAGTKINDVFLGSCMTNIGHFRAAGKLLDQLEDPVVTRLWIVPPTKMDEAQLTAEGYYGIFGRSGARTEMPGCSLCMGNQ
ncbi:bifunctional aconitate hydratase 2/2-methylisocitrate dehydratase, partial [Myxococcota bacterium]|nr:bifunctional aconitate hydratase 2/2-methylisocitrate dehydratase [Myxococcota bacterium]